jgi:DNA-binding SARP family transcriptional activator/tetratricopeptide (TPR) repeat protein
MEFRILGSLEAFADGVPVAVPSGRQRAVLAALLLRANRVISADGLTEVLWGSAPPPTARVAVQNYVKRLRDALGDSGRTQIVTRQPGYLIALSADELDLTCFESALESARAAAREGSWEAAAEQARAALELWRGEPLADVESEVLAASEMPRLTEMHLQAVEIRIEAAIHLGHGGDFVGELRQLVTANPLREHLHALLMSALHAGDRQAEALSVYQEARSVLVAELGAEPGLELRELQQRVLAGEPGFGRLQTAAAGAAGTTGPDRAVPRELPAVVPHFVGRGPEIASLTSLLREARQEPTLVISAIGGTAGVGKTALAVALAHQVANRFPDGQLYVNLRGFDPDEPLPAAEALASFLRALGVPSNDVPEDTEERARRYRSLVAGRRILVLLDNARDADHVRPLLPGTAGCAAIVTSRDALAGLVARDGARRIELDLLPLPDAVKLLEVLVGKRVIDEPDAAAALAARCSRLPLALRVAAELAATRPTDTLADLVSELQDLRGRLAVFDAGRDQRTDVRAVLSWSYQQLSPPVARAFRFIGVHPGSDIDVHAAAALLGEAVADSRYAITQLCRGHLLQTSTPGRYGMHDLLRGFARDLSADLDGADEQRAALTRLFGYYQSLAAAAMDTLFPAAARPQPDVPSAAALTPAIRDEAEAKAWLDSEGANLVAVAVYCAGHGWLRHASDLAATIFGYLIAGSHLSEALTISSHTLQAARRSDDLAAEAVSLHRLGTIVLEKGRFRDASGHYEAALNGYRQCGDRLGEARILHNLGLTEHLLHNHTKALGYFRASIATYRDTGSRLGGAHALCCLSSVEIDVGSYDEASEHLQLAVQVFRQAEDQIGEACAVMRIGDLCLRRGQLTEAAGMLQQAVAIYRSSGQAAGGMANALTLLGDVSLRQGEYQQAISHLRQALAGCRQAGYRYGEIMVLRKLAEAQHAAGQTGAARERLATAIRLAAETGNPYEQAGAHRDLAESHHSVGDDEQARHHWQQALTLYTEIGAPEADQLRSGPAALLAER